MFTYIKAKNFKSLKNIEFSKLDKTSKIIFFLLMLRMYFILVLMSKFKYMIQNIEEKIYG